MSTISSREMVHVDHMYQEHASWLTAYISRRLGCPETTAELVQDTYLRLIIRGELPTQQESRRYLTHIAKGLVVDLFRRRRVETAYLELLVQQPQAQVGSPEEQNLVIEALVEIDSLLKRLPNNARQALLMRQLEGKSYKQIAVELNVSVSSVEKYVAKALQSCMLTMLDEAS